MNCNEASRALLVADPDELRTLGDTPLAKHLRGCPACRAQAERILEATALLAGALTREARAAAPAATKRFWPAAERSWPVWLPAALGAAVSGILLINAPVEKPAPRVGSLDSAKRPVTSTVVNAPANGGVAVFKVADNVTVVWQLGTGGS